MFIFRVFKFMNVDKDRKIIRASINYPIKLIFSKYYVLLIVEKNCLEIIYLRMTNISRKLIYT